MQSLPVEEHFLYQAVNAEMNRPHMKRHPKEATAMPKKGNSYAQKRQQ
jgi:hypothetical protein